MNLENYRAPSAPRIPRNPTLFFAGVVLVVILITAVFAALVAVLGFEIQRLAGK